MILTFVYFSDKRSECSTNKKQSTVYSPNNPVSVAESAKINIMAHISNTHVSKGEGNDVHQGFDKDVHNLYLCVLNCDLKYGHFYSHIKTLIRDMI